MNRTMRPAWAEVNLGNVSHNVAQFRRLIKGDCHLMAVVKANGYGHGDLEIARTALASGATWLAVALPEEGLRLRRAGIAAPILVLGSLSSDQLEMCVVKDLVITVFQWEIAQSLSHLGRKLQKTVRIHMEADTGMGRLGLLPQQVVDFARRVKGLPFLEVQGIFTHFASADQPDGDYAAYQWHLFCRILDNLKGEGIHIPFKHCANTAATLFLPEAHLDMVRVGLGLYGLYPNDQRPLSLRPALELKARVTAVKRVPLGTGVSYGSTYVTWKETSIAVLPLGYGDGVSRHLSNRGCVLINGQRFPIVGRVTMDQMMVDVGDYPVSVGDEAVLLGSSREETISADDWASWIDTINYEVTCMIGSRITRHYA